jgi:hypothetical protein
MTAAPCGFGRLRRTYVDCRSDGAAEARLFNLPAIRLRKDCKMVVRIQWMHENCIMLCGNPCEKIRPKSAKMWRMSQNMENWDSII